MKIHKITYDTSEFPFRELVQKHFNVTYDLNQLHKFLDAEVPFFRDKTFDQSTAIHKHFYKIYDKDAEFLNLYDKFVEKVIKPTFPGSLVYQSRPTFRIHLPNNVAVGEWHKDSDYHHQRSEVNYWVPFTKAFGNNTIWIESEEDKADFQPYDVNYGEVLVFKGTHLKHGNKPNDTGISRVSMDFRCIAYEEYQELDVQSSAEKLRFAVGGYYELLN